MTETYKLAINQGAIVDTNYIENNILIINNLSIYSYIYLGCQKDYTKWMKKYLFPNY